MKRYMFVVLLLATLPLAAQTEKKKERNAARERIREQRVSYISEKLAFTPEESKNFWPVYNKFTAELENLKKTQNKARRDAIDKLAFISDQEADKLLNDELSSQQQVVDLQRKYQQELKKIIPVKKIIMLYKAERDFKLELLRKLGKGAGQQAEPED